MYVYYVYVYYVCVYSMHLFVDVAESLQTESLFM